MEHSDLPCVEAIEFAYRLGTVVKRLVLNGMSPLGYMAFWHIINAFSSNQGALISRADVRRRGGSV